LDQDVDAPAAGSSSIWTGHVLFLFFCWNLFLGHCGRNLLALDHCRQFARGHGLSLMMHLLMRLVIDASHFCWIMIKCFECEEHDERGEEQEQEEEEEEESFVV
jgi:hypothetical protein